MKGCRGVGWWAVVLIKTNVVFSRGKTGVGHVHTPKK